MDHGMINGAGFTSRQLGIHHVLRGHVDHGWLLAGASGPVRLDGAAWRRAVDAAFARACAAREQRASSLSGDEFRRFLSAASILCNGADVGLRCPGCAETLAVGVLGFESLKEIVK